MRPISFLFCVRVDHGTTKFGSINDQIFRFNMGSSTQTLLVTATYSGMHVTTDLGWDQGGEEGEAHSRS